MSTPKCCCGCCSLHTGVKVIAIVMGLFSIISLIFGIVQAISGNGDNTIAKIIGGVISLIVNVLLYFGCKKEKKVLFIPWMVVTIINIIALLVMAVIFLIASIHMKGVHSNEGQAGFIVAIILGVSYLLIIILQICLWALVLQLYLWMGKNPGTSSGINP